MAYDKTVWENGDSITPKDMNHIENGIKSVSDKASGSYTKNVWKSGDVVSAEKLNNIENGIEKISQLIDEGFNLQTKNVTYTPSENQITEKITKDNDYDFLDEVNVTVSAIPNNYVGTGVTRRGSNNVTVVQNPPSVTVPSGYYETAVSKELDLEPSLIRFIDYDGTTLYEYTKEEFLNLSSMPSNPSHTGLVAQGWNWSLSDAKTYVQQWRYLNIGQMYTTTSGDTEVDIYFPSDCARLSPYLGLAVNGEVDIDWGDNSTHSTVVGTSLTDQLCTQHVYSQPGNYTIKIHANSGSFSFYNTSTNPILNANNSSSYQYNLVYSNTVKAIRIGENCTIGNYSFAYCYSLQSVTIPSSITSIGYANFYYCYSLQSITIPSLVTLIGTSAFRYCYSLQSVTIPSSVTSINDYVFQDCYSLQSVTIPSSVTSIGSSAFSSCYSLAIRIIPLANLKHIDNSKQVTITNDSLSMFRRCSSISSVTIQNTVTSIGVNAFEYCCSLKEVTIPSSVTSIGSNAFQYCHSLNSITIPSSVTSIGTYVFRYCQSLNSITIPSSVTSIGSYAFYGCSSLQSVTIPNTITSISSNAFYNCCSLSSVTIPSSITSIKGSAFYSCSSLQSVTIPSSVTSIESSAFFNCYSLSSVTIPSSVTSIGSSAFAYCYGIKEYHLKPTTPPSFSSGVFSGIPDDCIIYVPQESLEEYKTAEYWSTYASKMEGE